MGEKAIVISADMLRKLEALPGSRGGTRSVPWTPEQDEIIRRYWKTKRKASLAEILGHHENTIRKRARALGVAT